MINLKKKSNFNELKRLCMICRARIMGNQRFIEPSRTGKERQGHLRRVRFIALYIVIALAGTFFMTAHAEMPETSVPITSATEPAENQLNSAPQRIVPRGLRMHASLYEAMASTPAGMRTAPDAATLKRFQKRGMQLRQDGKVLVEIIGPQGATAVEDIGKTGIRGLGAETGVTPKEGEVTVPLSAFENRMEAWLPLGQLVGISKMLPEGYFIKPVWPLNYDEVAGEGPAVTNSDSYSHQNGRGLTIAVIDGFYNNLTAAQGNGDAPAQYTPINYTGSGFESGSNPHGTGCVEAAFDHAPDARWRIYKIDSPTDLGLVVANAISAGVNVITHSISYYNLGWADDTGAACSAANTASDNGIIFFTAAGNRAQSHYQGAFLDGDNDNFHNFFSEDETINITIESGTGGSHYLSWSNPETDLDFYLYDPTLTTVVARSENTQGTSEELYFYNDGDSGTFHLVVKHFLGPKTTDIEIFSHNSGTWNEYAVASNSTTSPSNCTGSLVISVGAVDKDVYASPNYSNVIEDYSSHGPSNSGMTLPDITGPTNTTGFTYPNGFGGTSSATPNAAGAATAFWSADTNLIGEGIVWLIKEQADLWRDWGTPGNDNVYGKGGVQLIDYLWNTRWLARAYPGTIDNGTVPYSTLQAAHNGTPNNGRILVFGSNYPESATLGTPFRSLKIEIVPNSGSGIFGQ